MTQEQIIKIEKFENILKRGFYASGAEVVGLYNEIFNKRMNITNCSSCLRNYISQMVVAKNAFLKQQEASKSADPITTPPEEKEAIVGETVSENKPKKVGRPKKQ